MNETGFVIVKVWWPAGCVVGQGPLALFSGWNTISLSFEYSFYRLFTILYLDNNVGFLFEYLPVRVLVISQVISKACHTSLFAR